MVKTGYRPIVEAILASMPEVKVPEGMSVGLKFTSAKQLTHGGYPWPDPGEWAIADEWSPELCAAGGFHAATTILAAQSGGHRATNAFLVAWNVSEAVTNKDLPGIVKAPRMLTLARVDMYELARKGAFVGANLFGVDLPRANLAGADLAGTNFVGADLSGANLAGANLTHARFTGATLVNTTLAGAKLNSVNLTSTNLIDANLASVDLSDARLIGANLSDAKLTGATFTGAKIEKTCFVGADLVGADFRGAYLHQADFTDTKLGRAYFRSVTGDTIADEHTRWPKGFNPTKRGVVVR